MAGRLIGWIIPTEKIFFEMLEKHSEYMTEGVEELHALLSDHSQESLQERLENIRRIERSGDGVRHNIVLELHKNLITPIDREDINALSQELDDVLDYAEGVAERIALYKLRPWKAAVELSEILCSAAQEINQAIRKLPHGRTGIEEHCVRVHELKKQARYCSMRAISELFDSGDAVRILKEKEIIDYLKRAANECEDVADLVEGIVVKMG